jgi:excisionase family DNA binding protein
MHEAIMQDDGRKLLSPNNAARALDISRSQLYALMKCGALGYVQIGADRRIPIAEIERLAKTGTAVGPASA